jgi:drug/metabolite transporter (DMT)-like permease
MRLPSEKLVLDRATPSDVALRASTVGYLAFLAFAWGGNYAWTKLALADSGPWAFNALRYLCASIVLGAILLARGREFSVLPLRG